MLLLLRLPSLKLSCPSPASPHVIFMTSPPIQSPPPACLLWGDFPQHSFVGGKHFPENSLQAGDTGLIFSLGDPPPYPAVFLFSPCSRGNSPFHRPIFLSRFRRKEDFRFRRTPFPFILKQDISRKMLRSSSSSPELAPPCIRVTFFLPSSKYFTPNASRLEAELP